jgi:hypothetical protein
MVNIFKNLAFLQSWPIASWCCQHLGIELNDMDHWANFTTMLDRALEDVHAHE